MTRFIKENKIVSLMIFTLTILTLGIIVALLVVSNINMPPKGKIIPGVKKSLAQQVSGELDIRSAFVKVADEVGPAVASITTERIQKIGGVRQFHFGSPFRGRGKRGPFGDDFFDEFFRDFFRDIPEQEHKQMGLGSGVIIDKEGYILTNEHVVAEADKITVTLPDGREFKGELRGEDPRRDLAVVKIKANNLPVANLGDSDLVQTGEWAVAIGNPFGHLLDSPKPTVTAGVVSALHRSLPMGRMGNKIYVDLIQTDAAINQGNSGGPLCDLNGNVIGINVAIFSTTGGYQGIGFAIPINTAKSIIGDLIKGGEVSYGWLGVTVQDINQDIADYFGLGKKQGTLIAGVIKGGPAEKGGMKEGDIVTSFNGRPIRDVRDLLKKVAATKVGEVVKIGFLRDKKSATLKIKIEKRPSKVTSLKVKEEDSEKDTWRGIAARPITDEIAGQFGIENKEGVIIGRLEVNSPAYNAGLREGDIIREINRIPIKNIEGFNTVIKRLKGNVLVRTDKGYLIIKE